MNVEDVYNRIKKMGCRFNLVVANCCNDEIIPKPETNLPPSPHPKGGPGPKWKWDNVYALFMKQRQSFLLASASQGQESFTSNVSGSIYVNFLLNSLTTGFLPDKPLPNWPQIIQDVKMQTISRINNANITCPVPFQPNNLCVQTPTCLDCNKLSNH